MRTSRFLMLPLLVAVSFGCTKNSEGDIKSPSTPCSSVDVVLLIDHSGSMTPYLDAARRALEMVARRQGMNAGYNIGVVDFTKEGVPMNNVAVTAWNTDLRGAATVVKQLSETDGAGDEPAYGAVYMTATGMFDAELGLRPGSRRLLIVMGDEDGASPLFPSIDKKVVREAIARSHAELYVFTAPHNFADWTQGATATFALSEDALAMAKSIEEILTPAIVFKSTDSSGDDSRSWTLTTDREEVLKMLDNVTKD